MATRTINASVTLPAPALAGTLQRPSRIDAGLTLPVPAVSSTLASPIVLTGEVALPGLSVAAALRLPIRKALSAHWAISQRNAAAVRALWSMSSRDACATMRISWRLTYRAAGQQDCAWAGPRTQASLTDQWSLRLGMPHLARWSFGTVTPALVSRWSAPLVWTHSSGWASAPRVSAALPARWASTPHFRTAIAAVWGQTALARRCQFQASWQGMSRVAAQQAASWAVQAGRLCHSLQAAWATSDCEPVRAGLVLRWSGVSVREIPLPAIRLVLADREITVLDCELRQDSDSPAATALITPALWPEELPSSGTDVVLSIGGVNWAMVLTNGDGQASTPVTVEATLQLASPCIRLDKADPVALPYGGLASEIAAAAVAPLALTWHLPDWFLPPPLVAAQLGAQSPLAVAKALANAAGGVLMSLPSGDLLALSRQGGAPLDLGCAIESERTVATAQYSGVRVRAADPEASINVEGEAPGSRTLEIAVSPWRTVSTTLYAGNDASLSAPVETLRETTEQLQIIDGVAELAAPLAELVSTEWNDGAERTLHHRGRWVWAEDRHFTGLCTVTYRTQVLTLTASRTMQRDALAAVYEQEKTV